MKQLEETNIFLKDDFLSTTDYNTVVYEFEKLKDKFSAHELRMPTGEYITTLTRYYHFEPGPIIDVLEKKLYSKEIVAFSDGCADLAWQWIRRASGYEVQLTRYNSGIDEYFWHSDHHRPVDAESGFRVLNWILYLGECDYEGGELELSKDVPALEPGNEATDYDRKMGTDTGNVSVWKSVKPKKNRMVVMPSYLLHRVKRHKSKTDDFMDARITLNGHYFLQ